MVSLVFWSPKRTNTLFSLLGSLFRLGAVLVQKVLQRWKISRIPLFPSQKWKNRVSAILVEKRCPERFVYQGFCASRRKSGIRIFHFSVIFSILCRAKKNLHVVFILTGKQLFDGKHSSPKGLFSLGKSMIPGPKIAQDRFFCSFCRQNRKNRPKRVLGAKV